ncbi:MAG: molybdenum cofactor carrier [Planctomycetaceae bacterium]|jgi:hypothetical protein|nr:molybdenum cofactor carrier [Planctomycetaceae bacterium]
MPCPTLSFNIKRIISGGQTGVDRGALDAAIEMGIQHGGWCPQGRLAEDGIIPSRYELKESNSAEYWVRTEQNVLDSDGTLIIHRGSLQGGTRLTYRLTKKHGKPCFRADLSEDPCPGAVRAWMKEYEIEILNVAGPRESSIPSISSGTRQLVVSIFEGAGRE